MGISYEIVDCKPVPIKLAPAIREVKRRTGNTLTSCLRTQDAVNFARKRGCKLSSQAELRDCFLRRVPGCNPANPVGLSTHELFNDGVAYSGRPGTPLKWWQVGQDWGNATDAQEIVRAYALIKYAAAITYPGNSREGHHVNLRREPRIFKLFVILKRGSKGRRVAAYTRYLAIARTPKEKKPYLAASTRVFDKTVERAVRAFQVDHGQKPDGIIGRQTANQLQTSARYWKERLRARKK